MCLAGFVSENTIVVTIIVNDFRCLLCCRLDNVILVRRFHDEDGEEEQY